MSMDAIEFDSTLRGAQEGAEWAWSKLYSWLAADLRGYIRARGAHDPDDALGEVFLQLARGLAGFEGTAAGFRSWAFLVAHNRVIDQSRVRGRDKSVATPPEDLPQVVDRLAPEAEVLEAMSAEELRSWLIDHVTADQLDVILLRVFGGLTPSEIAETLGREPGAVRVSQHRALARLRKAFATLGVTR
jgi:RNA polymerase sigma-70 factor (ECF subfamily)